jgi:hypothetical protein
MLEDSFWYHHSPTLRLILKSIIHWQFEELKNTTQQRRPIVPIVKTKIHMMALFVSVFFLAACNSESQEVTPTAEQALALVSDSQSNNELELSETYTFPGFGFTIDYPAGWSVETQGTVTIISELESDLKKAFQEDAPPIEGFSLSLDQRTLSFMRGLGLPEEPTLEDLLDLNQGFFEWQEPLDVVETEAFGAPALSIMTSDGEVSRNTLMGYAGDRAFLLQFSVPSDQALTDVASHWNQMLASIQPAEE